MDNAKLHWEILQKLETELANRIREFMVIGMKGDGVIVVTEDGDGFRLGEVWFVIGETKIATEPILLNVSDLVHMAQGDSHILLLNKRGEIYSMGRNDRGQLGLGTYVDTIRFSPRLVSIPDKITSVRCGTYHSLALTEDGKVWAWGYNYLGQVGVSGSTNSIPSPHQISELDPHRVIAVECGNEHSLALTDQGEVYAWGANDGGQLGDGSGGGKSYGVYRKYNHTPTRISTPSPIENIAAGYSHTLLLTQTGEVYACGNNEYCQLGFSNNTESSTSLVKVAGLPSISQIAAHPKTSLSIAMSSDQRCFVWGNLSIGTPISTPRELPLFYSTVESPLSFFSSYRYTPHSVTLPAKECTRGTELTSQTKLFSDFLPGRTLPANNHLLDRIGKMFDNPDSSPDVRFQLGDQSILAHRSVLQISSAHFHQLFSSSPADLNSLSSTTPTLQSSPSGSQATTNPSEPEANSTPTTPHCPQVIISIPDHSYSVFYAYLHFLYLGILEVAPEHLLDLLLLSVAYHESELHQICLSRLRTTLTPGTCCLYYQLTLQHSLPELSDFQQELLQFISANFLEVIDSAAYQSMDSELCKKLTLSVAKHSL